MNEPDLKDKGFDKVEITAAEWFSRREFGLSQAESEEFFGWLNADVRHQLVFTELEQTSRVLDDWPKDEPAPSSQPALPGKSKRPAVVRRWAVAAGVAASIAVAGIVTFRSRTPSEVPYAFSAATEVGAFRTLSLPDGSLVRLNTDSAVVVQFSKGERRVHLKRGEAFFTVAKNPARPFYVDTSGVSVRAVGTEFNVRLQSTSVEVLVTEGRVRVEDTNKGDTLLPVASGATEPPVLDAGHEVVIQIASESEPAHVSAVVPLAPREMQQTLAWEEKRLVFESAPLSQVVAEFNRFNEHKLVIADPGLASRQFGGTFRVDGYETLLSLLEQDFDVTVDRHANETILRRRGH